MEVKEAYCSYEAAKLLKEKGFNASLHYYYDDEGNRIYTAFGKDNSGKINVVCPTHQMACAWIRKKGYSVEVHATPVGWHWEVCKVNGTAIAFGGNVPSDKTNDGDAYDDYDECMDNALMYVLTNLMI